MDATERYVKRILDISAPLRRKSQFLFGPRMTGKSTLIEKELTEKPGFVLNLLRTDYVCRNKIRAALPKRLKLVNCHIA